MGPQKSLDDRSGDHYGDRLIRLPGPNPQPEIGAGRGPKGKNLQICFTHTASYLKDTMLSFATFVHRLLANLRFSVYNLQFTIDDLCQGVQALRHQIRVACISTRWCPKTFLAKRFGIIEWRHASQEDVFRILLDKALYNTCTACTSVHPVDYRRYKLGIPMKFP